MFVLLHATLAALNGHPLSSPRGFDLMIDDVSKKNEVIRIPWGGTCGIHPLVPTQQTKRAVLIGPIGMPALSTLGGTTMPVHIKHCIFFSDRPSFYVGVIRGRRAAKLPAAPASCVTPWHARKFSSPERPEGLLRCPGSGLLGPALLSSDLDRPLGRLRHDLRFLDDVSGHIFRLLCGLHRGSALQGGGGWRVLPYVPHRIVT